MSRRNSAAAERAPPASLTGITIRTKSAAARKRGDLTNRLFEEAETHLPPPRPAPVIEAKRPLAPPPAPEPAIETEPLVTAELDAEPEFLTPAPEPVIELTQRVEAEPETAIEPPAPVDAAVETEAFAEPAPAFEPEPMAEPEPIVEPEITPVEDLAPAPMPVWTPPAPKAEEPPPEPVRAPLVEREEIAAAISDVEPAPTVPVFTDLPGYWRHLRGSAEFPTAEALDRDVVAARWPGSLLIAFMRNAQDPRSEPSLARVTRLGIASADAENAVDYAPYATEWMLDLGRAALEACEPIEELQRLPTRAGASGFRLIALPLGPLNGDPDSVLCQLAPDTAAPRFGKKRNWLED